MASASPVKNFQFIIEIDGVDQLQIQKIKHPEMEVAVAEHGGGGYTVKTAGMASYANASLEKLTLAEGGSRWAWDWINDVINPVTGSGKLPIDYKRNVVVKQMAPNGVTAVRRWLWEGAFPVKISQTDADRLNSDNSIETIEMSIDRVTLL